MEDFENQHNHEELLEMAEKLKQDGWILDYELHYGDTMEDSGVFISMTPAMKEAFINMLDNSLREGNSGTVH